ncbi:hypothetical protein DPMN_132587 [Dreissena polymorpha]|uniref:Uncharacterized protein n=1 Tax=Dreissena polymorpha TaxID=45954 RepID=A0A9D4JD86_DREPO|nr:hypothetical protein DPMN_132587 [Dreissena polymorpha]
MIQAFERKYIRRLLCNSYTEHNTNELRPDSDGNTFLPIRAPYGDRQTTKYGLVWTRHKAHLCARQFDRER